ncbi:unnamed protein product [Rotaria sordida]|uniref:G-protein coupled receptors family 1 profile domain-containing protein n=1 Tax=Rotaria sordida TaxID=392033 RepID=A0A814VBN2_9BILA|nr:unnamed protein product [Rotaria sordida]CAF1188374.1 unnamed protein product [Rotaria sordida]CAF3637548.1 unnamed protein product [Rotaria sordida]CAF3661633.1 unnamed protein product [Rotaria sordida]
MSASLYDVRVWMTRYIMGSYLILGVIGNLINIFMFTRRKSRLYNSCSLYLLAISISHILNASWGIIPSIYNLNHVDPSTYSYIYCKLRSYSQHSIVMIGRTLMVVACIDRYAICSNYQRFRLLNKLQVAFRIIIGIIIAWPCINIYLLFVMIFTGKNCVMLSSFTFIWAIYTVVVPGILTPLLMTIFGLLAIRNRRRLQGRLNGNRNRNNKRDYTLMVMLLSEVLVYVISTSSFPVITLYKAITTNVVKSVQRQEIETFITFFGSSFLLYLNPSSTFYIFIIVSNNYRHECKRAFLRLCMRLTGGMNKVSTIGTNTFINRHNETQI